MQSAIVKGMNTTHPLFVRSLTTREREALATAVRARDAFVLRRAPIILASAHGERVGLIAPRVGVSRQGVRHVIHAFNAHGLAVLQQGTTQNTILHSSFATASAEALRDLLHHSPRDVDKETSVWTLEVAADVAYERGLTAWRVRGETVRATLARMGVRWKRAKAWITRPDPEYVRKKARRDRLIRLARATPCVAVGRRGRGLAEPVGPSDPARVAGRGPSGTSDRADGRAY